jgi:hypothetical protein
LGRTRASGEQPTISNSLENEALKLSRHLLGLASASQFTAESIAALLKDFRGRLAASDCKVLSALTVASPLPVTRVERVRKCYVKRYLPNTTDALGAAEAKGLHQTNRAIA